MPSDELFALTTQLVAIPSVSRHEAEITDWIEQDLVGRAGLEVIRIGDNVVARTTLGRDRRIVLAGHTDTVPPNGNDVPEVIGDRLYGVGSTDMKGGLAVMLHAARTIVAPAVDVTYVFYAREEIAAVESGLLELANEAPELLEGDLALLGEPTDGVVEAGCQGTMRVRVAFAGVRAHPARPWMGRNAIHRMGAVLEALTRYEERRPEIAGCVFREALQAVQVAGGVAGNVVPDHAELLLNHRFAPDRTSTEAMAGLLDFLHPWIEDGDVVEILDVAEGAAPCLDVPPLAEFVRRNDLPVRAKLGWTDVARFAALGIPAANFGPGDAEIAHMAGEFVTRDQLERTWRPIARLLSAA